MGTGLISADESSQKNAVTLKKQRFSVRKAHTPKGVEPLEANQQSVDNKELTENANPVFATGLAKIVQKYPELEQIITAWPQLPEHTKTAIKSLIQKLEAEKK